MPKDINSENEMKDFGRLIGSLLCGGEIIELLGDVGVGKTTLVKGIAIGLGIDEYIQSPSFTINRVYKGRDDLTLSHYDFYRLNDAGIMTNELQETISDPKTITIIEWGEIVAGVLPSDRLSIYIISPTETSRRLTVDSGGDNSRKLENGLNL
ncbi:MAG: tRNA (adenosine(37)-N6)-threonylcarbamoyltransferase complex ATPase subunit type 1 TsaE [Candidatus Saccharibacteria bacterium]